MRKAKKPKYKLGIVHDGEDVITVKKYIRPATSMPPKKNMAI